TVLNVLLAMAMGAIPGLTPDAHKEDMLHVLAEHYVGPGFARASSLVFGILLLSASNTAIVDLISIQYLLARDREMPPVLARLNRFGVPAIPVLPATLIPILVLALESRLDHLAALYAIGVVGAIAINLGTCVFSRGLEIRRGERVLMAALALLMGVIELTIA